MAESNVIETGTWECDAHLVSTARALAQLERLKLICLAPSWQGSESYRDLKRLLGECEALLWRAHMSEGVRQGVIELPDAGGG